ncbi:methyl-accepting chemotaxis protein [Brevibacillus laterosporus]|uniref:Methyl-accepting chemotaxis protein n=1 Tax=Brevibacillus laterosporus TaxID=1465 RepID=A0A518V792_BRELA|nr:methyl-accepting chemotaxis protein [Brevibacillus laterosporus]QDX92842.1 methyl-accepting chemotaxis protein [Brevibacillus laterosporus]TPG71196.1 methyl-accepting chemotaxis protein [Brevibacillus laterosporus]
MLVSNCCCFLAFFFICCKNVPELTASSENVAKAASQTAQSQYKSHDLLQGLQQEIYSIYAMGTLMKNISDQTHLLGLNAAIEAARAEASGRGFEVVANVVRKLAEHSKISVDEINKVLNHICSVLEEVLLIMQSNRKKALLN